MAPDVDAVRIANERFYRAFESLSLAEMEPRWLHRGHVACIHPGWPRLVGWDAVRESWDAIFTSTHEIRFTLTDVRVEVCGDLAWVLCTENILSETRGNLSVTAIQATNLFESPRSRLATGPPPRLSRAHAPGRRRDRPRLTPRPDGMIGRCASLSRRGLVFRSARGPRPRLLGEASEGVFPDPLRRIYCGQAVFGQPTQRTTGTLTSRKRGSRPTTRT